MTQEQEDILALFGVPGVGSKTFSRLVERFGSAAAVFSASERDLLDVERIGPVLLKNIRSHDRMSFLRDQKRLMDTAGAALLTRGGPGYPPLLDVFTSAPPVLFVRGDPAALSQPSLAFVGTRHPSSWGVSMTGKLVAVAAREGFCTVSGMASGIDSASHLAAIENGGKTAAVFGCGVDIIYPSENRNLSEAIRKSGCLVSHFLMGTACSPGNFPARNALIVGLSQATVIVEAPKRSGALITADLTLRAKRPLFTVLGNADSPTSEGTNALLGKGALPVSRFEDIARHLGHPIPEGPEDSREKPPRVTARALPPGLGRKILGALDREPQQIETLCARLGAPVALLLTELTILEMDGYIRQRPGKIFEKV